MIAAIDFGSIFQSMPGNYIILLPDTPKFTIVAFNHARASETFTTQEDIGKGIFEAFPDNPDDAGANGVAMLTASLEMVIREKQPHQMAVQKYDIPNSHDNGFEIRYWLPKNIPVLNEAGEITCIIHHVQDITDQRAFADELRKQVDEKTVDLKTINAQLEKSNQELEQFAHVTSHDLQEPLRKIQLFSASLADNPELSEKSLTQVNKINAAAKRMSGLTKDLLEYARLSQNSPQFRPTDLNAILENVLSDFELVITQKKAVIKAHPLEIIEAVSLQMNQLFFNLIGNALKFSKKNKAPVIAITGSILSEKEKKGFATLLPGLEYYAIRFSDNGIGFEEEYAEKIFSVFQRLNQHSEYGGYGIGLALCSRLVNNHNGLIYATSRTGEGSIFTAILPMCQQR